MLMTFDELAAVLDPPVTRRDVQTLIWLAGIGPSGRRPSTAGRGGHPLSLFDEGAVRHAHAQEAARTRKQFTDCDWIGAALLARRIITADTEVGEIRWADGTRAEILVGRGYGYVPAGPSRCAAHRIIWMAAEGEIPPGMVVNHKDNLHWRNPIANLELASRGNNIKHHYGKDYHTYHQAVAELQMLPPEPPRAVPEPALSIERVGGAFRPGV